MSAAQGSLAGLPLSNGGGSMGRGRSLQAARGSARATGSMPASTATAPLTQKKLMLRSQSGEGFDEEQKKKGRGLMEKSSSVPFNMHSEIDVRRWESLGTHAINMEGHCVIKNSRFTPSKLQVVMTAKNGQLCIYFEQLQAGIWRKFRLVDLDIKGLVLMYSMRDPNSFYIATPWKGSLEVSIYCTPDAQSTNSWLLTLQHMGARMEVFKERSCAELAVVFERGECQECIFKPTVSRRRKTSCGSQSSSESSSESP